MRFTESKKIFAKINDGYFFVIVIFFALSLRLFDLNNRPFHTDEAVHAIKFADLLENGKYIYDPIEYHGPTLNYFSLITAKLSGENTLSELNEITLRIVPAVISLILILMTYFIFDNYNKNLKFIITILISISPIFVFYGRYYIQETLLVTFAYSSLLTFYKYLTTRKLTWIVLTSVFSALVFCTKETSIIIYFSAISAMILIYLFDKEIRKRIFFVKNHALIFSIIFFGISIIFYSSFFSNPSGILDSLKTFTNYFNKAGSSNEHIQPWYYYFEFLLFTNNDLIFYTEIPIFILAIFGFGFLFLSKKNYLLKLIALFCIIQAIVYALIPYKTPWLALNFWIGFLFIASFGMESLLRKFEKTFIKNFLLTLFVLIFLHSFYQSLIINFAKPYQPENPFTYSQPTPDIISASEKINKIAEFDSMKNEIFINVIAKDNDYWPLPWYLRKIKNIAWNNEVKNNVYVYNIIITSPEFENEITEKLYSLPKPGQVNLYVPLFDDYVAIRPNVEIVGYIQNSLYDKYLHSSMNNSAE